MGYVSNVKHAIYNALSNYDCDVEYTRGSRNSCAYFTVTIDDEWCWDWIQEDIDSICEDYDLWIDDDSDGDFDLCVNE